MALILSKPKGFLGIDFGSYSIKVAEVTRGSPPELRSFGQVRVPSEGIKEEEIEQLVKKLSDLINNLKIKTRKTVACISSYASIIKRIEVTLTDDKDIDEMIKEETEAQIPFDIEEVYYDYFIINSDDEKVEFLMAAAKKEAIENIIEIIEGTNLELIAIDIDVITAGNLFEQIYKKESPCLLLDLGASKTTITIWEKNKPHTIRDIGIGINDIKNYVAETLNIKIEDAEKIITEKKEEYKNTIKTGMKEYYQKITDQIKETINTYKSQTQNTISQIFIYGGGEEIIDKKSLEKTLNIKTETIDVFSYINYKNINKETLETIRSTGLTAISAATREIIHND